MDGRTRTHVNTIGPRSARPVAPIRNQPDEALRRVHASGPRRTALKPMPAPDAARLTTAIGGMLRYALPHITGNAQPTVRIDIRDAGTGTTAGTLTLPAQLVDLVVLAVAAVGEQYRVTPVADRPALHLVTAGGDR